MLTRSIVSIMFLIVAAILIAASFRNFSKSKGEKTVARKIWLRMALVFAVAGVGLCFLNHFSQ